MAFAVSAEANVMVTFSGGNGTPLTVSTNEDIVFTNVPIGLENYAFVVLGAAGGSGTLGFATHTGTMGWNGTGDDSGNGPMGALGLGDLSIADDFVAYWETGGIAGNAPVSTSTMTLNAGFRTTTSSVNTNFIQGEGSYVVRMLEVTNNTFIGDPGVAVPEPQTVVLIALGIPFVVLLARGIRRRRA